MSVVTGVRAILRNTGTDLLNFLRQELYEFIHVPGICKQRRQMGRVLVHLDVAVADQLHGLDGTLPVGAWINGQLSGHVKVAISNVQNQISRPELQYDLPSSRS